MSNQRKPELNTSSISFCLGGGGGNQAGPSLFTALINELPTRAAELLQVSAISTFNGSLKVTARAWVPSQDGR